MAVETNRQDVAGKGIITECYVYSGATQKRITVLPYLLNIDIYEDIYNPFVYCDMVFYDYDEFTKEFPLTGEEYFVISYQSFNGKPVRYHFLLYKLGNVGMTATNSGAGFVVRGVTLERAMDSGKTVASAFTGTCSEMAAAIFKNYVEVDTGGLTLNFEPSRGVDHYIPPQISPLSAINELKSKAVPLGEVRSPFMFFRSSEGYFFQSLNGLFNVSAAKPSASRVHRYAAAQPSPEQNEDGVNFNADIVEYDISDYYDTMSKIDRGGYNSHVYAFDLTTKWFGLRQIYNATDYNGKFQLGGDGMGNRNKFMSSFNNKRCVSHYIPTNLSREFMGTSKDTFPDFMGEMAGYINLVTEHNVRYTIYGDSDVTAGQVMKILVPAARDHKKSGETQRGRSNMFSGSFLLTSVKHSLTVGENIQYYTVISGVNGARSVSVEKG